MEKGQLRNRGNNNMPRYFIELCYQGTAYHGFQVQDNAVTIQSVVEKALTTFYRQDFSLTGSSRTDAGVHALQNFFHVDTELQLENKHAYNLNALLPPDIAVKSIKQVAPDAHCRFDAVARSYQYYIYKDKDPFKRDRGWFYPFALNIGIMQEGAAIIMEYTDFTSFSKRNTQVYTHECTIFESRWEEAVGNRVQGIGNREEEGNREKGIGDGLVYYVKANRFLRGMVRGLVGTMVKLGREQLTIADFRRIIAAKDCTKADFTTPPQGLFLEKVWYP
jgi:tRNA pseudouridine38-40 synthase